jgi:L-ascorbate metabolism protein UlaG (beta-lactamase superfamily)
MSTQKTAPNTVLFSWFNQYAGILINTPTKTFAIDPVDIKPQSLPPLDAILITHEHHDHLDPQLIAQTQKATACTVIADVTSAKKLQHTLPADKLHAIQPGETTNLGAVAIQAEKSIHPAQTPITFIITSEDQIKIYHTSDSAPFPEMAALGQKKQFDVVFCTVGIAPGATPQTGFDVAWLTKPQIAVPYHTRTEQSQKEFAALVERKLPKTTCLIPQQNTTYQINKVVKT